MAKDNWSGGERNRVHFHLGVREKTSLRHLIHELGVRERTKISEGKYSRQRKHVVSSRNTKETQM